MKAPEEYRGPLSTPVPCGYTDITSILDQEGRRGIPSPEHPYYAMRNAISRVLQSELKCKEPYGHWLAEKILEAL